MHDIKIPDPDDMQRKAEKFAGFEVAEVHHAHVPEPRNAGQPAEMVKVKFSNFVQLVATHNFEEVLKDHGEDDVVVSTNLLTDLANAHEEEEAHNNKLPVIFLVGIILGIIVTYIVIQF